MNRGLDPNLMTPAERLDEIAAILAVALMRLRRRESERHVSHLEKNGLDFSPRRGGHATARQRREVRR